MFCKHCGTSIPQGSSFCPSCGKSQDGTVMMQQPQMIGVQSLKSLGVAIALTVLFGPLGLLYASVKGGLITTAIGIIAFFLFFGSALSAVGGGYGDTTWLSVTSMLVGLLLWPTSIAWAWYAVTKYNDNVRRGIMNSDVD